jgi:hypothetical protein
MNIPSSSINPPVVDCQSTLPMGISSPSWLNPLAVKLWISSGSICISLGKTSSRCKTTGTTTLAEALKFCSIAQADMLNSPLAF